MNTIALARVPDFDHKKLLQTPAEERHAIHHVTSGTRVVDKKNGKHVLTFLNISQYDQARLLYAVQHVDYQEGYRTQGLKSTSRIFGFQPRSTIRQDFVTQAKMARDQPAILKTLIEYGHIASAIYQHELPVLFQQQVDLLNKNVLPEYRYPGAHFTSGIVNKRNRLLYHRDQGNFPNSLSTMISLTRDMGKQGMLVIPEYKLALEFNGMELLIFNGAEVLHGVSPIQVSHASAYRYTVVYYALQQLNKALPVAEELTRAREKSQERARIRKSENRHELVAKFAGKKRA
jgi:hypothetical protein